MRMITSMASLLAGAANAPISASIVAVELFGPAVTPYATVACVISFLMTGHRSVFRARSPVDVKIIITDCKAWAGKGGCDRH